MQNSNNILIIYFTGFYIKTGLMHLKNIFQDSWLKLVIFEVRTV